MRQFGAFSTTKGKKASGGFIPNFTALNDAIGREAGAGTPMSRIRVGKDSRLTSATNPLGLGVYNTKDEPMGLGQGVARYGSNKAKTAGVSKGFVPNFILPALPALAAGGGSAATMFILRQVLRKYSRPKDKRRSWSCDSRSKFRWDNFISWRRKKGCGWSTCNWSFIKFS